MTSFEEIINFIFGGQVDATKIITILVGIWAIVKSITEWRAKKKLLTADLEQTETQRQLTAAKEEIKELKSCISTFSDVILTAYLSSNTIPEETKKQIGYLGAKLDKVAGVELQPITEKLIDVATTIAPEANLQEHKEELQAATELAEEVIDGANEVVQDAIDKIKIG